MRSIVVAAAVILVIALAVAGWYFWARRDGIVKLGIEVGQMAPNFTLTDIDDVTFSLSDYRDNIVVIDFTATWCPPCVAQKDHLKRLFTDYRGRGVVIMSIGIDPTETDEILRRFREKHGDNWIFASGPAVSATYGVTLIPTIYIIDRQGRVAYGHVGLTPYSTLAAEVDKLL